MRMPLITLLLIAPAIAIALWPGASAWLVYDRSAILNGQIWRMFTGHWVHFSISHLIYDSLVLGAASWMVEAKRLPQFALLCLLTPWLISGMMLITVAHMETFGGLSALAMTALVYLALFGLRDAGPWRWASMAVLAGIGLKIIYERSTNRMIFASVANDSVTVCAASHVCGAAAGVLFYFLMAGRKRPQEFPLTNRV